MKLLPNLRSNLSVHLMSPIGLYFDQDCVYQVTQKQSDPHRLLQVLEYGRTNTFFYISDYASISIGLRVAQIMLYMESLGLPCHIEFEDLKVCDRVTLLM